MLPPLLASPLILTHKLSAIFTIKLSYICSRTLSAKQKSPWHSLICYDPIGSLSAFLSDGYLQYTRWTKILWTGNIQRRQLPKTVLFKPSPILSLVAVSCQYNQSSSKKPLHPNHQVSEHNTVYFRRLIFCSGLVLKLICVCMLCFSKNMLYTKAHLSLFEEATFTDIIYRC